MDLVQIGKFIAELRKAQGLTQEQFGEKVGVTNKTVSNNPDAGACSWLEKQYNDDLCRKECL